LVQAAAQRAIEQGLTQYTPATGLPALRESISRWYATRWGVAIDPARIIVAYDEIDLPAGRLRLKIGGGHAGHNGVRSMMAALGTGDFVRLRVGIGRPKHGTVSDFVLSDFAGEERDFLPDLLDRAVNALRAALREGAPLAMNTVNST
jgi:PTH1 family peptidyl-tRNA hydrolase